MRSVFAFVRGLLPALSLALVACSPPVYQMPSVNEPHATVKLRINYHSTPGPNLNERLMLGEHQIPMPWSARDHRTTRTTAIRVHPETAEWRFSAGFFHSETYTTTEHYQEQQRYACGTEQVSYGSTSSTRTRYCTRSVPKTRQVTRTRQVDDGSCRAGFGLTPRMGATYLVQYDFYGHRQCVARCYEQLPQPGGQFQLAPCPFQPPPR